MIMMNIIPLGAGIPVKDYWVCKIESVKFFGGRIAARTDMGIFHDCLDGRAKQKLETR
ncbi:MAG: hypothetical protein WAZ18_05060 [Alphaproteobacteria bacterium]